jgi:hypothetical protein
VSTPRLLQERGTQSFGAWDRNLYAVNRYKGEIKLEIGINGLNCALTILRPACTPVLRTMGLVYDVAQRTGYNLRDKCDDGRNPPGEIMKRLCANQSASQVMENLCTQRQCRTTVVGHSLQARNHNIPAWKTKCGFGYEHAPSIVDRERRWKSVFFGTKNGRCVLH